MRAGLARARGITLLLFALAAGCTVEARDGGGEPWGAARFLQLLDECEAAAEGARTRLEGQPPGEERDRHLASIAQYLASLPTLRENAAAVYAHADPATLAQMEAGMAQVRDQCNAAGAVPVAAAAPAAPSSASVSPGGTDG